MRRLFWQKHSVRSLLSLCILPLPQISLDTIAATDNLSWPRLDDASPTYQHVAKSFIALTSELTTAGGRANHVKSWLVPP